MLKNKRAKGTRFEHIVRDFFKKKGCLVVRQASSKFPDLIVIIPNNYVTFGDYEFMDSILFVECKVNGNFSNDEIKGLITLSKFNNNCFSFKAYPKGSSYDKRDENICLEEVRW